MMYDMANIQTDGFAQLAKAENSIYLILMGFYNCWPVTLLTKGADIVQLHFSVMGTTLNFSQDKDKVLQIEKKEN